MDWFEMLSIGKRVEEAKKESPDERYARVEIDLGAAENVGKNIKIHISGDYLAKIKYNGSATGCYFKFGNKRSSIIYASEFRKRHTPFIEFSCIFLTNEVAQAGKVFTLFVGGAFAGEIEPSTGIKTGLIDSDGVDVDPAIKDEYDTVLNNIKTAVEFGGNIYSKQQTSTNALVAVGVVKLRDVVIKNADAANAIDLGETQVDVATFRAQSIELAAGGSIGFTQVDLATLFVLSSVAGSHATIQVIGTEI